MSKNMSKITFNIDTTSDDNKCNVNAGYYDLNIKDRLALLKSLDEWLSKELVNVNEILVRNNIK